MAMIPKTNISFKLFFLSFANQNHSDPVPLILFVFIFIRASLLLIASFSTRVLFKSCSVVKYLLLQSFSINQSATRIAFKTSDNSLSSNQFFGLKFISFD